MYQNRDEIRRVMIAVNVIDGICDVIAKKIGIKENALTLLYALDDGKSHSQKEICEEWFIPKTTLNTIVKECTKEGYIFLNTNSGKKEKEICLTEKGREFAGMVLRQVYELEQQAMDDALERFSPEFIHGLEQFTANLKEKAREFCNESGAVIRKNITN